MKKFLHDDPESRLSLIYIGWLRGEVTPVCREVLRS
jgi:hypothetical protein